MNDEELIERFENCSLPIESFCHQTHVKLAWLYLHRYPKLEALERFSDKLKIFAGHLGKFELYHETITWGHILLMHERMTRAGGLQTWEMFAGENADLMNWRAGIFKEYYSDQALASEMARQIFIFPDKIPSKDVQASGLIT